MKDSTSFLNVFTVSTLKPEGIIGGAEAPLGKYSYQVALKFSEEFLCRGSIFDENHIITADHCVTDGKVSLNSPVNP